jgi:hypothetical protein
MSLRKNPRTGLLEVVPETQSVPRWIKILAGIACAMLIAPIVVGLLLSMFLAVVVLLLPAVPLWIYFMHGSFGREPAEVFLPHVPEEEGHEKRPPEKRTPLWSTFTPAET